MDASDIRLRTWVSASSDDERSGLLGFITVFVGTLVVDGITLRRTADGRFALSFPSRTDRSGHRHAYVRPVDDAARTAIERALFAQLGQHLDVAIATEDQP